MESYWWCQNCKLKLEPEDVTFEECHDDCGHPAVVIEPKDQDDKRSAFYRAAFLAALTGLCANTGQAFVDIVPDALKFADEADRQYGDRRIRTMAKCQHYTTRERVAGLLPCKQDAVIWYDHENRCPKHAAQEVLYAVLVLRAVADRAPEEFAAMAKNALAALKPK